LAGVDPLLTFGQNAGTAVQSGSVGSDTQLDVPDQIFSTTLSRISAERSG
jgi:hypothetical protein